MLETSEERVRLLRAGVDGKTIEMLYIINNNFKIVLKPVLVEFDKVNPYIFETTAECAIE